jgi:hypothetical protein
VETTPSIFASLDDLDWVGEVICVTRPKQRIIQRYPLLPVVGDRETKELDLLRNSLAIPRARNIYEMMAAGSATIFFKHASAGLDIVPRLSAGNPLQQIPGGRCPDSPIHDAVGPTLGSSSTSGQTPSGLRQPEPSARDTKATRHSLLSP